MNKAVIHIYDSLNSLLSIVFSHVKQDDVIIFESNPSFTDNTRYVFEEMLHRGLNAKYKMYWIARDGTNISNITKNGNCFVLPSTHSSLIKQTVNTIKKAYIFSKAKCIISCNVFQPKYTGRKQYYVHLNHGASNKNSIDYYRMPDYYDHTISISEYFRPYLAQELSCPIEKAVTLGYPRNDMLFEEGMSLKQVFSGYQFDKVIYWLPTFRQAIFTDKTHSNIDFPILYTEELIEELNRVSHEKNVLIVIKPHPVQIRDRKSTKQYSNIVFIDDSFLSVNEIDNYEILRSSDALITDYSSVYYDFLLCNKPVALCFDDFEEYSKRVGFIVDPSYVYSGGEKVYTIGDLCDFVGRVAENKDLLKEKRNALLGEIYENADRGATKRVTDFIISQLEKYDGECEK